MTERKCVLASSSTPGVDGSLGNGVRHSVYPVHGVFPFSLFSDHRLDRARRLAMPDECKIDNNPILSYRKYYIDFKKDFARWKNRDVNKY